MSAQDREDRIKELEGFCDDWQEMIDKNDEHFRRLLKLKSAGIDEYDQAIIRSTEASKSLAAAKSNIEAAITRVRSDGL